MTQRRHLFAVRCTALMAAAGSTSAMPPAKAQTAATKEACVFSKYEAGGVAPFNGEENYGYGSYTAL